MHGFENELKSALARREPPDGFASRVMDRIPERRGRRPAFNMQWRAAAAAVLIAMLGGGAYEYNRAERLRRDGEQARAELVFALELTSSRLQATKAKVLKTSGSRI